MELTAEKLSEWCGQAPADITEVNLSSKDIHNVDAVADCTSLRKLNLSKNNLKSVNALSSLESLTWLNLAQNQLKSVLGLKGLDKLNVLNLSGNQLDAVDTNISEMKSLKALILNNNQITKVDDSLASLSQLNTLVLSHNKIRTLPPLNSLPQLAKISAAHNEFTTVPDFSSNTALKELRMNDNNIDRLPDTLRGCTSLEILDLGNNQLSRWSDIAALGSLLKLTNLNLKGNPVVDNEGYREKILAFVPSLRVLDGQRFDPKFLERKKKQEANFKLMEKKQRLKREKQIKEQGLVTQDEQPKRGQKRHATPAEQSSSAKKQKDDQSSGPRKNTAQKAETAAKDTDNMKASNEERATKPSAKKAIAKDNAKRTTTTTSRKELVVQKGKKRTTTAAVREGLELSENKAVKKSKVNDKESKGQRENKNDKFFVPVESSKGDNADNKEPEEKLMVEKPRSAATRQRSGVVGIVDKTKAQQRASKKKEPNDSKQDVIAALLDAVQEEQDATGTGLGVGGWDD